MIDYIPPDIPPAIVKYADEKYKKPKEAKSRWFHYLTHINNVELYAMDWNYDTARFTGYPFIFVYDCHNVHRITKQEWLDMDISIIYPKYISQYAKEEHLCHKNLKAFNQHTKPSDYKKKVKHITAKYIPSEVVNYIDKNTKDSWYPGATKRYIKYLTTFENKSEVYFVYWTDLFNKKTSNIRPFLYDCNKVRRADIVEWGKITKQVGNNFNVSERPYLCTSD